VLTVFEKIPDLFVQHYDSSFQVWAREFRSRGNRCAIPFDRLPGAPVILGPDGKPSWKGAWLEAEVDRSEPQNVKIVIRPADDQAAALIEQHTREMSRHWLT
jgi:hypothetical protein